MSVRHEIEGHNPYQLLHIALTKLKVGEVTEIEVKDMPERNRIRARRFIMAGYPVWLENEDMSLIIRNRPC